MDGPLRARARRENGRRGQKIAVDVRRSCQKCVVVVFLPSSTQHIGCTVSFSLLLLLLLLLFVNAPRISPRSRGAPRARMLARARDVAHVLVQVRRALLACPRATREKKAILRRWLLLSNVSTRSGQPLSDDTSHSGWIWTKSDAGARINSCWSAPLFCMSFHPPPPSHTHTRTRLQHGRCTVYTWPIQAWCFLSLLLQCTVDRGHLAVL